MGVEDGASGEGLNASGVRQHDRVRKRALSAFSGGDERASGGLGWSDAYGWFARLHGERPQVQSANSMPHNEVTPVADS